jgi:8-oxo-dGTP pyrophosphatase MutT (NUDIX family)
MGDQPHGSMAVRIAAAADDGVGAYPVTMVDRFRLVPAVYVYLRRDGEVLLQERQNTGFMDGRWAAAISGHVEAGESVVEAAVREAREETGVVVPASALKPLTTLHRTDGSDAPVEQRVDFCFECWSWVGEPVVRERAKASGMRWFRLDALPEPMPPHERWVLERLEEGDLPAIWTFGFPTEG